MSQKSNGTNGKPSPNGDDGRDSRTGKFLPGNTCGAGNPLMARIHDLKDAILNAATPEKAEELMDKCHELALAGDMAAARVWFDRAVGKPDQRVEIEGDISHTIATVREGLLKLGARFGEMAEIDFN